MQSKEMISTQQLKMCNFAFAWSHGTAAPFRSRMLPATGRAGNWLGSLPGNHSSYKWLSRWFWLLWVRTKPKVQLVPRFSGTVEMLWAWLVWDTEDLWCSSTKGDALSDKRPRSRGQKSSWHHSVALSLAFPSPGELWWLSVSGDLKFKSSLFLLPGASRLLPSHELWTWNT